MYFEFYNSKKDELEVERWLKFLKEKRNISDMPEIPINSPRLLACHNNIEIYFNRDGRAVGHLILEERPTNSNEVIVRHLPKFRYWEGNPEDKIIDKPVVVG